MIPKKQTTTQEMWIDALENIAETYNRADFNVLVEKTVAEIRAECAGLNVGFGWSGGKDSLVLEKICKLAGIELCVWGRSNLEYPGFVEYVETKGPSGLEIVNTGQDLEWLAKHPEMLFPQDAKAAGLWFKIVQHTAQRRFVKKHELSKLLLGRRRADGNFMGRNKAREYTDRHGVTRYSPLGYWTHEDVLMALHVFDIQLPECYFWPNGFKVGTGPWAARQWTGSIENGWREVYVCDQSVVHQAAEKFESARRCIEEMES